MSTEKIPASAQEALLRLLAELLHQADDYCCTTKAAGCNFKTADWAQASREFWLQKASKYMDVCNNDVTLALETTLAHIRNRIDSQSFLTFRG